MISRIAAGEYTPRPGISSPGPATTALEMCCPKGESCSHVSKGIVYLSNQPSDGMAVGGKYSMLGNARILSERFGVPPCQQRLSRKMAAPCEKAMKETQEQKAVCY